VSEQLASDLALLAEANPGVEREVVSEWTRRAAIWENEDGDTWVEVDAVCPTEESAGRAAVDSTGLAYVGWGRSTISTQGCECLPIHGTDPGECGGPESGCFDHPGEACEVQERVEVWHLYGGWDLSGSSRMTDCDVEELEAEVAEGKTAYLPDGLRLEGGSVMRWEAESLPLAEAPSVPMGLVP
jgi:hypothetical protein